RNRPRSDDRGNTGRKGAGLEALARCSHGTMREGPRDRVAEFAIVRPAAEHHAGGLVHQQMEKGVVSGRHGAPQAGLFRARWFTRSQVTGLFAKITGETHQAAFSAANSRLVTKRT